MRKRLERLVPDLGADPGGAMGGALTNEDYDAALEAAVSRYSMDRPATSALWLEGPGPFPLPADWWPDRSRLERVFVPDWGEFPAAGAVVVTADGYLRRAAETGERAVRVSYTRRRGPCEVPGEDTEAVLWWAAAYLLDMLATRFTGDTSPSVISDSAGHQSKGADFERRAGALRKLYWDHLGVDPKKVTCAGAVITTPPRGSSGLTPVFRRGGCRVVRR